MKLLILTLFISHWQACVFYYVGLQEMDNSGRSWITESFLQDASLTERYVTSMYFAITTMTTVIYNKYF